MSIYEIILLDHLNSQLRPDDTSAPQIDVYTISSIFFYKIYFALFIAAITYLTEIREIKIFLDSQKHLKQKD